MITSNCKYQENSKQEIIKGAFYLTLATLMDINLSLLSFDKLQGSNDSKNVASVKWKPKAKSSKRI